MVGGCGMTGGVLPMPPSISCLIVIKRAGGLLRIAAKLILDLIFSGDKGVGTTDDGF